MPSMQHETEGELDFQAAYHKARQQINSSLSQIWMMCSAIATCLKAEHGHGNSHWPHLKTKFGKAVLTEEKQCLMKRAQLSYGVVYFNVRVQHSDCTESDNT